MNDLSVSIVLPGERAAVEAMLQLYIHDFSELFSGTPRCDLENDGRYAPDIPIGRWWAGSGDHVALVLRVTERLAGFALLNKQSHEDRAIDWSMAEFFIVRKYRRGGIGTAAAQAIFGRFPGRWEAVVMRPNTAALPFWDAAIRHHPGTRDLEIVDSTPPGWDGAIFRFSIAPS